MLMGLEEFCGVGIEAGVEKFAGSGDVDFSVFDTEVVAVNGESGGGEQEEAQEREALVCDERSRGVRGGLRVER
jgi:hypothetical protein